MNNPTLPNKDYIMVVEDDEFYAKIFKSRITEAGLPVTSFTAGDDALDYAQKNPPKLIIADLVMPRLDGFKFIELVRQVTSLKKVPILVFSNLGQDKDINEAKRLGATDYVIKTEINLSDAIAKIISYYNAA